MQNTISGTQYEVIEWNYLSGKSYPDPFNEVTLDVQITDSTNRSWLVPAFWCGENKWGVRFSAPDKGRYSITSLCSDANNHDLHNQKNTLHISPYKGENQVLSHGSLQVAPSKRYFEFQDGTPFFWLADTWWMAFCKRLSWPDDIRVLVENRVNKGFTVIQIVAGLYPDMPPFDERGMNEAGFPWDKNYVKINPAYFNMADLRLQFLVKSGLIPCIVGAWGYHLQLLGVSKMKQHWRNLIARWGAYPVIWCTAGEAAMPYYLSENIERDKKQQIAGWTEVGRYIRKTDPFHRVVTIHPASKQAGRDQVDDDGLLDFDMLQTGHQDYTCVENTITIVSHEYSRKPTMPVINGEVVYEGHMQSNWQNLQRFMFWSCMLNGASGHTYGAGGIWQINTQEHPYGASPHGGTYENTPWDQAMNLPGSEQLGIGKALLLRYPWWRTEPHPEWVEPHWTHDNYLLPYAAGIPGELRIIYIPGRFYDWSGPLIKGIEKKTPYKAFYVNPIDGKEHHLGAVRADTGGSWKAPNTPLCQDWVLVLERL